MKHVTVFCGSQVSGKNAELYKQFAYKTGKQLAEYGFVCVNGGTTGMMEEVSRGAMENAGKVLAIAHEHPDYPITNTFFSTQEKYTSLYTRQQRLIELADVFLVLPGAVGTLYEAFEVISRCGLGEFSIPIIFVTEYFEPIQRMLKHIQQEGFAWFDINEVVHFVSTPQEAMQLLSDV